MLPVEVLLPCIIIRPLVTAVQKRQFEPNPCVLVLTTVN